LIATDFSAFPPGMQLLAQRQSTNLSTGFCGYRKIHYIAACYEFAPAATQRFCCSAELAPLQRFALESARKQPK
jgi:hypothetical protein